MSLICWHSNNEMPDPDILPADEMTYPQCILPKLNYKLQIDLKQLIANQNVFVVRRSDFTMEDTFTLAGTLNEDAIKPEDLPLMSMNLLGGLFEPNYSKFVPDKSGRSKWEKQAVLLSDYGYEVKEAFCLIYINANLIDEVKIKYLHPYKNNSELVQQIKEYFGKDTPPKTKDDKYIVIGNTELKHDPTNLNYWHVEYNVQQFNKRPIKNKGQIFLMEYCADIIKNAICGAASNELGEIDKISESFYLET